MVTFEANNMTVDQYLYLRSRVEWKPLTKEQAQKALDNSLYVLAAYHNGDLVGMGRLVGDAAVICYIQDLIVDPSIQNHGIGTSLLRMLTEEAMAMGIPGTTLMLDLMCAKGREHFYINRGFMPRPNDELGPGMIRYLKLPE